MLAGPAPVERDLVLDVRNLRTHLVSANATVRAVDGVSFEVRRGETLGIVGESGSGKSMTSLSLMGLLPRPAGRIVSGEIILSGRDLVGRSQKEMVAIRGREISMILQDPQTSLNPVYTIGDQLMEALATGGIPPKERRERAIALLRSFAIAAPERRMSDYPHQMSGGMKQRVVGAIALACAPQLVIADEPTTALDVTIQLQYLKLLKDLQKQTGMSIIFITHDFGVVARMCDRVAVMYAGRIVEQGDIRDIFDRPGHPYTQALLAAVPGLEEPTDRLYSITGQPPLLSNLPEGCRFAPRCPHARNLCRSTYPPSFATGLGHVADCWRHDPQWAQR